MTRSTATTKPHETPKVSVVIPVFNRFEYLAPCLQSLKRQTLTDLEIIVVDDGSDAETKAFLNYYAEQDPRIRLMNNPGPKGATGARNTGLRESRAEFVVFLDSDDMLAPFCLERRLSDILNRPDLDFIAYPCLLFRTRPLDRLIIWNTQNDRSLLERFLCHDAPFQTSGPIWRRSSLIGKVCWEDDLPGWQDWVFHVEALLLGLKGELKTRIDYFWNEPKPESVTQSSHNTLGRARRMQSVRRLARIAPKTLRPAILASIVTLGVRIRRNEPFSAARLVLANLKGEKCSWAAAVFVLFHTCRRPPLVWIRGWSRKRAYRAYPIIHDILHDSNTYKLTCPRDQLGELITNLNEIRHLP